VFDGALLKVFNTNMLPVILPESKTIGARFSCAAPHTHPKETPKVEEETGAC